MAIGTPEQKIGDFFKAFLGQQPVYSNGRRIGYFRPSVSGSPQAGVQGLCSGYIVLDVSGQTTDPNTWTTNDFWGRQVPVTKYCLVKGIVPNWLSPAQKGAAQQQITGQVIVPGVNDNDGKLTLGNLPQIAAIGAVSLGVLLLLVRR